MAMTEKQVELVVSAKTGDKKSFEELYGIFFGKVYALARMVLRNEADAEDVLQETFITAWRKIGTLENEQAFSVWIQIIAKNICYMKLRKKDMTILLDAESDIDDYDDRESDELFPAVYIERAELRERVGRIVEKLSDVQRETIVLYYYNQLSVAEISEVTACTEGTVKSRLFLARKAIRAEIEEQERKSGERFFGAIGIPMLPFGELIHAQIESFAMSQSAANASLGAIAKSMADGISTAAQAAENAAANSVSGNAGISSAPDAAISTGQAASDSTSTAAASESAGTTSQSANSIAAKPALGSSGTGTSGTSNAMSTNSMGGKAMTLKAKIIAGIAAAAAVGVAALLVVTMSGGGPGAGPGTPGNPQAESEALNGEDICLCCPDCDQKECECAECGDSDDCECKLPGSGGTYSFKVEIDTYVAGWRPIHKTLGVATVTMAETDEQGYSGSATGAGKYIEGYIPETGQVETIYDFELYLSDYDPVSGSITVSFDRVGLEIVTNYSMDDPEVALPVPDMGVTLMLILCQEHYDPDTGLYSFTFPLVGGSASETFNFDRVSADFEGHIELTITVTPV